jgi:hypothetical protein
MGIFSKLFGTDNAVDKGFDLVDKAFYTDQEAAADSIKKFTVKEAILKAYEPFKLAQRYMMIIVGVPYVLAWTAAFFGGYFVDTTPMQMQLLDGKMGMVFLTIAGFYFGGGLLEGTIKAAKKS